jgi:aspartokinase
MSIQSAIKKFLRENKVKSILKASKIGATINLSLFQIKKNNESLLLYDNIKIELMKSSDYIIGAVGERYISLAVDKNHYSYIYGIFEKYLISVEKKVACISLDCSKMDNISGIITYITSILSQKNISMYGFFTSQDDILMIISEENAFEYVAYIKEVLKA